MHIIRTPADIERLHHTDAIALIRDRLDLLEYAPIVIIEPGDTEQDIINDIGFSPLVNRVDGERFPSSLFTPSWEFITHHQGWHELVYVTRDDGSGFILLIADREGVEPVLLALCRST